MKPLVAARKVILAVGPLAASKIWVTQLSLVGAARPFVLADVEGTGARPSAEQATCYVLGIDAETSERAFREYERRLASLPDEALAAIEQYDPAQEAVVVTNPMFTLLADVGGRLNWTARPRRWYELEDKCVVDRVWDAARVPRVPAAVVEADLDMLQRAASTLDRGRGTVWCGDIRSGVHGSAQGIRWVRTAEDERLAHQFFQQRCDRVRIMPFLEGVPCSIHGMVINGKVISFRPIEMLTLRESGRSTFRYAGCASYWDPPISDRRHMRGVARAVGAYLRDACDYRGSFSIDGVLTEDGFFPTELNPRYGMGLSILDDVLPALPFRVLDLVARTFPGLDLRPSMLEELVVNALDQRRGGSAWSISSGPRPAVSASYSLVRGAGRYHHAAPGGRRDAVMTVGPTHAGTFVRFVPEPDRTPVGEPLGPRVVEAYAWADREIGTQFGPLTAASRVFRTCRP
ncbi:MAG: hypothetical protein ACRD0K_09360 [Egibacteraceae bacterium]